MNRSIIFRNANKLVKQGYSRSEALREAWRLAKLPEISVKVKGTAATEQRQEALAIETAPPRTNRRGQARTAPQEKKQGVRYYYSMGSL